MTDMPERIWLMPGAGDDGETLWCDDPAPGVGMDPSDAVEYRRSDLPVSVAEAARLLVEAWDRENPIRTADMHPADCDCARCTVDRVRALAAQEDT